MLTANVSDAAGNAAQSVWTVKVGNISEKSTVPETDAESGLELVCSIGDKDMAPATVLAPIKVSWYRSRTCRSQRIQSAVLPEHFEYECEWGYWLKVSETVDLDVEGMVPAGATITVKTGWNLVGYPRESGAAPADELKSLGNTVEQIKNLSKSYDPSLPFFLNTLGTMVPGEGYWLKVTENGTRTLGDTTDSGQGRAVANEWRDKWGKVVVSNLAATVLAEVTQTETH